VIKFFWGGYDEYKKAFLEGKDVSVNACLLEDEDRENAYFVRCLFAKGIDAREYEHIFQKPLRSNRFFQSIFDHQLESHFTITEDLLCFSSELSKMDKRNFLFTHFLRYPLVIPKQYESCQLYEDTDVFFDY
jgi:hypothetical protein